MPAAVALLPQQLASGPPGRWASWPAWRPEVGQQRGASTQPLPLAPPVPLIPPVSLPLPLMQQVPLVPLERLVLVLLKPLALLRRLRPPRRPWG